MNKVYLFPGKIFASQEPIEITTILGSCVAVALFDPVTKAGGLNHFLLPKLKNEECENARYGVFAIPELIRQMTSFGIPKSRLQAKVYGGGSVIGDVTPDLEVGKRNIESALEILEKEGIPILEKNVGGIKGRRIVLMSNTFEVKHQLMGEADNTVDTSGYQKLKTVGRCKVLIVDDSATVRTLFHKIFTKHGLIVVGAAANAFEARELIVKTKPDVMTLDIEMPQMSGVQFLEKIMQHMPTPTVMVSSLGNQGEAALRSLELGAVEFIQKPSQYDLSLLSQLGESLVEKVRAAASVNLTKLTQERESIASGMSHSFKRVSSAAFNEIQVIGISGNAGSHINLEKLLHSLPADTPPVLVSNSTVTTFLKTFVEKMGQKSKHLNFVVAENDAVLRKGYVYFAPAGVHLKVKKIGSQIASELFTGLPVSSQLPSGNVLFDSLSETLPGKSLGVLLGGYGTDGVAGLGKMQSKKCVTMTEDPQGLSFPFAPQSAINQGIADHIVKVEEMNCIIMDYRNKRAA